jgi:hypothetical protein
MSVPHPGGPGLLALGYGESVNGRGASAPGQIDLPTLLGEGVAVVVATADEHLRPQITRGWGPQLDADGETVTLCVGAPPGSPMRANLDRGGVIAATFSLPTTYRTVQLKGPVLSVGEPGPEQLARVEEHIAAFGDQAAAVRLPSGVAPRLREHTLVAVDMAIRERYDQTPGPKAGSRL